MPIRVLHVISHFGLGGAQNLLKQVIDKTDPDQIQHFVYPLRSVRSELPLGEHIIGNLYGKYDFRKFTRLLTICRQKKIDILHAHLPKPVLGALLATWFLDIPVIIHEHCPIMIHKPEYILYRNALKLFWRRASLVISVSEYAADYLSKQVGIPKEHIRVLPNCIDIALYDQCQVSKAEARRKYNLPAEDLVAGCIGRLHPVKGFDIAIRAIHQVCRSGKRVYLVIAGEGPHRRILEKTAHRSGIADRIRFLGYCRDMPEILKMMDMALIPSRQELFGIVGLECMRMKVPIITSGAGGLKEFITDRQTGIITRQNTPAAIAEAMEMLISDPPLRERLLRQAHEKTLEFGIEAYQKKLNQLYQSILRNKDAR